MSSPIRLAALAAAPCLLALAPAAQLQGAPESLALSAGGTQSWRIETAPALAGAPYLILGSASGTAPGLVVGPGLVLPLNPDAYLTWTLTAANQLPLTQSFGVLDANGVAEAGFVLPAGLDPGLAGLALHHAAAVFDAAYVPQLVTNAVPLQFVVTKEVWEVNSGGPGDFVQIAEAIASPAVLNGHVLLVHKGVGYANFVLDKDLHLIAAAGERFSVKYPVVQGVGDFTLSGMDAARLDVNGAAGRGRLHDLKTGLADVGECGYYLVEGYVRIEDADQLVISNSKLAGSSGHYPESGTTNPGLSLRRSNAIVVDSVLDGGTDDWCGYHPTGGAQSAAQLFEGSHAIFAGTELWAGNALAALGFEGPPAVWVEDSVVSVRGSTSTLVRGGEGFSGLGPAIHGSGASAATISGVTQLATLPSAAWVVELAVPEPYLLLEGDETVGSSRTAVVYGPSGETAFLLVSTAPDLAAAPLPGYDLLWIDTGALLATVPLVTAGQDVGVPVDLGDPGLWATVGGGLILQAWFPPGSSTGPFVTNVAEALVRW